MFLKTLTLKGFKSFADATSLDLEPGITVVVGPNGSGKSNIVDAVAWVLGAQGPRTVRSQKMEDVIFAGTAKRSPLGRAEVSLTIDNSSGLIPIEFSEVTITRILWRSGESEYAINGTPCRLLDIQELLSDTGVGRQQHVIVSQGQMDAVLNAQPTDRRLIIEEAAGILKFRRRREKAQRRLESTEGNLLRVQDLLREVRRQLRPLERQADAARRHGAVVAELNALRLHLTGRELASLQARAASVAAVRADATTAERSLVTDLARLDADVLTAEAALAAAEGSTEVGSRPLRDRLADDVARAEGLRGRARGLAAVLAERGRSLERLRTVEMDADLVASLEAEAAELSAALHAVEATAEALLAEADHVAAAEADLARERAAFDAGLEAPPVATDERPAGAAEVRGEMAALRAAIERGDGERRRVADRQAALTAKEERLAAEAGAFAEQQRSADGEATVLSAQADHAVSAREAAESALERAEHTFATATAQHRSVEARVDALAQALDEARAQAGLERLTGIDGIVGTLLDVVDVDEGWEAAFEAAIGEAIAAVVVADNATARVALAHLHAASAGGAVLALGGYSQGALSPSLPGCAAVRDHVRSAGQGAVDGLLDRLLATAVAVEGSWVDALDVATSHPDLIVVTRAGDRFATAGWRAGSGGARATGSALEEARTALEAAAQDALGAISARDDARRAAATARSAEADAARALDQHGARRAAAVSGLSRAEVERREVGIELDAVTAQASELAVRVHRDRQRAVELAGILPGLEEEEAAGLERAAAERAARGRIEQREAAARALRTDLEVRAAGLEERRTLLARRQAEVEARLGRHFAERDSAEQRRVELTGQVVAVSRLSRQLDVRLSHIDAVLTSLQADRRAHAERTAALTGRLEELRRERASAERSLGAVRERLQRAELEEAETRVRIETATDACRRELDCEPAAAMAAPCPDLPPGTTAEHRARELERDLRLMGPINPLALEEHAALLERHTFLEAQLEDIKAGRRELAKVIRAIDTEIVEVFSAAYADVADNFTNLFATLFPGGFGRLRLTDPDNLLDTGIEVEARPSGKNVKRLSLLSGGERSLTAMAYLFAVFRSRPSPFYLMDEVEAALDDVNLHRFLDLIREFQSEAQLVIVSHQKRTMEAADCLYGVTMQPGGSSKVISERVAAGA